MGKKQKKLTKFNRIIRQVLGSGFDEGVTRLSLDQLIEMALASGIQCEHLTRDDLIRAFRRVWSSGDVHLREAIVAYLKTLPPVAPDEEPEWHSAKEKIDALIGEFEHTPEEYEGLVQALGQMHPKKINRRRVERFLKSFGRRRTLKTIAEKLHGTFEDQDVFVFEQCYRFDVGSQTVALTCRHRCFPADAGTFETDEALYRQRLEVCRQEVLQRAIRESEMLQGYLNAPNVYLDTQEKLEILARMKGGDWRLFPFIPDRLMETIIKKIIPEAWRMELTVQTVRLFADRSFALFGHPEWRLDYRQALGIERDFLRHTFFKGDRWKVEAEMAQIDAAMREVFEAELGGVVDAMMAEGEGLAIDAETVRRMIATGLMQEFDSSRPLKFDPSLLGGINKRFRRTLETLIAKKQREELLAKTIRDFKNLFPLARSLRRRLIFHVGPTNSGKTYAAMQTLIEEDTGCYLAPLRLLALEGYETILGRNLPASLVTGEEQILDDDAGHVSSTIEMANFQVDVDVCVIDEVQMIADPDRGWAWANAMIGIPAKRVIMTGSEDALNAVKLLAEWLDEPLEIRRFERMAPLEVMKQAVSIRRIPPASAIIAFSRRDVLSIKEQLSGRHEVSVIYGNLGPEVRREEARRFREGESKVLVATDAIAMGLNLPIQTILFARDSKFDGVRKRLLEPSEIRQISGRAGRYGHYEKGYVGALSDSILQTIAERIEQPSKPIEPPFNVMANLSHIELVSEIIETSELSRILEFFIKNMQFDGPFVAANLENMLQIAMVVDHYNLDLTTKYHLACAPVDIGSISMEQAFGRYITAIERCSPHPFEIPANIADVALSAEELFHAEERVKEVSLYLWLSYRFETIFYDTHNAKQSRNLLNRFIEKSLKNGQFAKVCKSCGQPMPPTARFAICEACFRKRSGAKRKWAGSR